MSQLKDALDSKLKFRKNQETSLRLGTNGTKCQLGSLIFAMSDIPLSCNSFRCLERGEALSASVLLTGISEVSL